MPVELCGGIGLDYVMVRLCNDFKVLGDEKHYIYDCPTIDRSNFSDTPLLDKLGDYTQLPILINVLSKYF